MPLKHVTRTKEYPGNFTTYISNKNENCTACNSLLDFENLIKMPNMYWKSKSDKQVSFAEQEIQKY